jgi:fatty acid desaturase
MPQRGVQIVIFSVEVGSLTPVSDGAKLCAYAEVKDLMKLWKHSPLDAWMAALSLAQLALTLGLASYWERSPITARIGIFVVQVLMITYNIIIISHQFGHTPWFNSPILNMLASMLNSINAGQSVDAYRLRHVRNHHRFNNDRKHPDGKTRDLSSTFQMGHRGEHATLLTYVIEGAVSTFLREARILLSFPRLWRVGKHERELLALAASHPSRRRAELRQIRFDRVAQFAGFITYLVISWRWTVWCYLPAFYTALVLVNMQNYYEHFGALPESRYANSVSYYGGLYNFLTFNDGYHQEHHLCPYTHWTHLPTVAYAAPSELNLIERVVSPVPAILGVFHRNRPQLHRHSASGEPATSIDEVCDANCG